jgi:hypothetical protein
MIFAVFWVLFDGWSKFTGNNDAIATKKGTFPAPSNILTYLKTL